MTPSNKVWKPKKVTRQWIIDELVRDAIDTAMNDNLYLHYIFCAGFKGFNDYTDRELVDKYNNRYMDSDNFKEVTI